MKPFRPARYDQMLLVALLGIGSPAMAADLPTVPVGLDAYRQWDRWAQQRFGVRAYMRSTYDRRGGNEGADASHFLYQLADDFNVTLHVEGPGILCFARYNHWHGSPWHYEVDGIDHRVQESTSADPTRPVADSVFLPREAFPNPLTWTWSETKGADLMWVPIPFERSFRMAYSRTRYGTGYYIYQQFVRGVPLSQPIRSWRPTAVPKDVLQLVGRAGTDLLAGDESSRSVRAAWREHGGRLDLPANQRRDFLELNQAGIIRALEFRMPRAQAIDFGRGRLRVTWDGRGAPSIDAPVALFFGTGTLYNRDDREYLVKGFPMFVRYLPAPSAEVHLACFFPMPFFRSARFELVAPGTNLAAIRWSVRAAPLVERPEHLAYFHATYRDHPQPARGQDLVLLDTPDCENAREWSGHFAGLSWIFSHRAVLNTLEGDPRFFFDDSQSPQAYGTGTEEWGGGGDYWGGRNMTLPFAGHPVGARDAASAKNEEDQIESAYRFLLADLMPFGRNARLQLEHGGLNESTEHYESVVYWYGLPAASLRKTDELKIADPASEAAHAYHSPTASEPYPITSRYEWGPDQLNAGSERAQTKPSAQPAHSAEFEFDAPAGRYTIWIRGRNLDGDARSDASWLQFDEQIGTDLFTPGCAHAKGFGNWLDRFPARTEAWSSALPQEAPQTVIFARSGKHQLRLQSRDAARHQVTAIWLSATQTNLPDAAHRPTEGPREIVLRPERATRLRGSIRSVTQGAVTLLQVESPAATNPREVYPAHTDRGRTMRGVTEFTVKLDPQNFGVLLRRKLDYALPNQRAQVYVADASGEGARDWQSAGAWFLAGGNTCVYSNPRDELGATQHVVQTSNRRFRDDEFLVPRALTEHRSRIRVRIQFTPVEIPLFPGHALPALGWSEIRYDVYCFVLPQFSR